MGGLNEEKEPGRRIFCASVRTTFSEVSESQMASCLRTSKMEFEANELTMLFAGSVAAASFVDHFFLLSSLSKTG